MLLLVTSLDIFNRFNAEYLLPYLIEQLVWAVILLAFESTHSKTNSLPSTRSIVGNSLPANQLAPVILTRSLHQLAPVNN